MIRSESVCPISDGLNLAWSDLNVIRRHRSLLIPCQEKLDNQEVILKSQHGKVLSGEIVCLLGSRDSGM